MLVRFCALESVLPLNSKVALGLFVRSGLGRTTGGIAVFHRCNKFLMQVKIYLSNSGEICFCQEKLSVHSDSHSDH